MARDFYAWFPLDLPALPSVRRLRRHMGPLAVLMYYELRIMAATAYQYGQHAEVADALDQCADWGMDEAGASECLRAMADYRLIDPAALEDGFIGIEDVAERAQYLQKKAEAGRKGNEKRWGTKKGGGESDSQTESLD